MEPESGLGDRSIRSGWHQSYATARKQVPVGKYLTEARSHRDSEKRTWIVQAMDLGRTAQPYASSSSQKVGGTNLMLAIAKSG